MKIRENLGVVLLFCLISKILISEYTLLAELSEPLFAPNINAGIEWGTELSQMPNMKLIKTGKTSIGEIKVYENKDDALNYKEVDFNSIEYGY